MKITVFTGNQPRHIALIQRLAKISDHTFAIMECNTVFPGKIQDHFKKSDVMQAYFSQVMAAEQKVFGPLSFSSSNTSILAIKDGDLNHLSADMLRGALSSDVYVVFGASYIKGWLIDFLVEHSALNIHMGISPYYRGSSCNFWALYDGHPELVGATIHHLSKGLDSGAMLYHALPKAGDSNPFEFTMQAVLAAHTSLADRLSDGTVFKMSPVMQDKSREVRYSRSAEFTDAVAHEFLNRNWTNADLKKALTANPKPDLLKPYYLN